MVDSKSVYWFHPQKPFLSFEAPPDYLNDLNAMHSAVMGLNDSQKVEFVGFLYQVARQNHPDKDVAMIISTSEQQAWALLNAVGKWTK